ncbi:DsbA family protein [Ornithinimicrobium faecis]|uniref:DsbA family protein n=1 Tax=Ornithinimicrobium faecis TaxID=2934158 RepID=UPI0021180345|nr:thioredoxin domain-containing protein [Ornithinimicrobium sp. HY1745]
MAQKKNNSQRQPAQKQSDRERVRQQQQEAVAKEKRMKVVFRSLIGVAVLAVVAVVAAIALNQGGTSSATPTTVTDDGGIVLDPGASAAGDEAGGDGASATADDANASAGGVPQVSVYLDYQCPHCLAFEQANLPMLSDELAAANISLAVHPVALMDNASQGTDFSSNAANAAVCVAENQPDAFLDVNQALFDLQGSASQGSVTVEALSDAVADAGADSSDVRSCILDQEFDGWVRDSTDAALSDPSLAGASGRFGTPTVLVDGQRFEGNPEDPEALTAFIEQQG